MKKKLTFLLVAFLASLGMMAHVPRVVQSDDGNVAKVGSTEYATIEEAVAAWGPGKTLTLLDNVTTTSTVTVEVNATKSTQGWTLDLGDYTWTASGCNAFQLYAAGGTVMNQNYGLKIYANENGGITASGKYCIECTYDNASAGYRPRLEIHGGTYNASYIIFYNIGTTTSSWGNTVAPSNGPSVHFIKSNDGTEPVFNGNFGLSKCPVTINAGFFNGTSFVTYPVSSTADTKLQGGHFITLNAFPSAGNNKGIVYGNYRILVNADQSIDVTNGEPASFEASTTSYSTILTGNRRYNGSSSSYYPGLIYFESANYAIQKYNIPIKLNENVEATQDKTMSSSGTLTIDATAEGSAYTGNVVLANNSAKLVMIFPEGTGHYGVSVNSGQLHVVETVNDGIVTRTYSRISTISNPEAKVDNTSYSTVYDAFYAVDGSTDNKVIVLQKDVTNAGIVTNGTATGGDGKTVATFDLNGKSIGVTSVAAGNNADYTLTIIDSSAGKTGTVTNTDASLFILALTGINDYSGSYTLKVQAGTWQFDPSAVVINGETHNLVDEGYVSHDNGNGTWTVGEVEKVAQIGTVKYVTIADAVAAANEGDKIEVIKAGTYTLPGLPKNVTIEGAVDDVVFNHTTAGNVASVPNGATFKNVAFNFGNVDYHGFQHAGTINMENCTLNGKLFSYGDMNFTDCQFNQTNSDYHMWAYSGNLTYTGCTFTNSVTGKFLNIYNESGATKYTVTVNNCNFVNNASSNKAALNVKATSGSNLLSYDVVITNCTTEGAFPIENIDPQASLVVLNPVVQVDDRTSDGVDNITVTQDGVEIYPLKNYVAQIGETKYITLTEAFAAAERGETVKLLVDYDATGETMYDTSRNLGIDESITFDGDGHTLTVKGRGIAVGAKATSNIDVKFQNINILNTSEGARCIDTRGHILNLELDGVTLNTEGATGTMQPLTIGGSQEGVANIIINNSTIQTNDEGSGYYAIITFNPVGMEIKGSTIKGWACIYAQGANNSTGSVGSGFTLRNSTFVSKNVNSGASNAFAAIMIQDNDVEVDAENNTFNIINTGDQTQALVGYPAGSSFTGFVHFDEGNKIAFDNQGAGSCSFVSNLSQNTEYRISGGEFTDEPDQNLLADGLVVVDNDDPLYLYTVAPGSYVAQIGDTKYTTLQKAVDAAEAMGGEVTIELLDNITGETVTIKEIANLMVTIDGKKDDSSNYTVDAIIVVDGLRGNGGSSTNGASVTLQNIAFVDGDYITAQNKSVVQATHYPHHLTIQDCTYSGKDTDTSRDRWFFDASVDGPLYGVTVKNVTVENSRLIYANLAEASVFENIIATTGAKVGFNIKTSGTVLIKDCQVTTPKYAFRDYSDAYEGTITLEGNTFISTSTESDEGSIVNRGGANGTAHIYVNSGTYVGAVTVLNGKKVLTLVDGHYSAPIYEEACEQFIVDGKVGVENLYVDETPNAPHGIGYPVYVAQIGEAKYTSLAKAVAAVPADGTETTIVMIDNHEIVGNAGVTIPATKNVVLDLNGKTVTGVVMEAKSAQAILNVGTLTITDSSEGGTGVLTNRADEENSGQWTDRNWATNVITNTGTLTVAGGSVINTAVTNICYAIDNNSTSYNAILNVTGGLVTTTGGGQAVRLFCNSTTKENAINISGGTVKGGYAGFWVQLPGSGGQAKKATVNITGGKVEGSTYAWYDYTGGDVFTAVDYNITGGFFKGSIYSYGVLSSNYKVLDGFISGGYFAEEIPSQLIEEGKALVDNTEPETMEEYPYVIGLPEIYYSWMENGNKVGEYCRFVVPFENEYLMDGEFIDVLKDINLSKNVECKLASGSFNLTFGDYQISKGDYSVSLLPGVTVYTDKQTDIFSAATEGYGIFEETTETGFAYTCRELVYVAQIGDVKYTSLANAVAAVPTDGTETTIVMIDNHEIVGNAGVTIPATKNVVLDLNGKTVTGVVMEAKSAQAILNVGTLTITDSSEGGTGVLTNRADEENSGQWTDRNWATNVITNTGTLTVAGGSVINTAVTNICYAIDNNSTSYNAILNVTGGLVTTTGGGQAVRLFCNSTTKENAINISGGTVKGGYAGFWVQLPGSSGQAKKATVNITGGKVEGDTYAWYDWTGGDVFTAVNYNITGGFFKGNIYSYGVLNSNYKVLDGFISGGYFSEEIYGQLIVEGKALVDNTEPETMEEYPYVIGLPEIYYSWMENGNKVGEYCLFVAPFDNEYLMDGEFIDVLKDINLSKNVECKLESGSFNLTFGDYQISKGDYSVSLLPGVTVYTDKQTDIFSAATEGYSIYELTTETGFAYVCGKFVAKIDKTLYETFEEAAAAVSNGQTIELLADVAMAENITADKSFTVKTEGYEFNPAGHTITIAQTGVTVNVEIPASIINSFASATAGFNVEETVITNGYAYSLKAVENIDFASIIEGYYHIKNLGNSKYVNVLGRRTATVNTSDTDAAKAAGAVIKVKATNGKVEILRSQAIDIPHYAQRAMSYVPGVVRMLVDKLRIDGSGNLLGENGVDAILEKFENSVDPNLYVEEAGNGVRIFGRTPSMQPVLEFYQENKENVDAKLPMLEDKINAAIDRVIKRTGMGSSFKNSFSLHTIWERMGAENLTEPNDEASKLAFLQEVLSSQNHVWNFAFQTATFYMEKVEGSEYFNMMPSEIATYWNRIKQIHPNFKYYIVQTDGKMDIISEGNIDIINNADRAIWQLEPVTEFTLNVPETNYKENEEGTTEYYTTLYTDFGYQLPAGAVAMKVTGVKETTVAAIESDCIGLAETEEIGQQVAPQTPVLIKSDKAGDITLTIGDNYGEAVDEATNLLHGADWLINEYEINSPAVAQLFEMANSISSSASESYDYLDQHEYLQRLNSGTVGNKYFFGLNIGETFANAYKDKTGNEMEETPIRILDMLNGERLVFNESWDDLLANRAFIFSEEFNPIVFSMLYVAENVEKETGYETIDEAFTEVEDGQTIKLLDNVAMAENFTADKSFTLKTEGFTFDPASHTITIAQEGVTVNVEIAASIIDSFASASADYTVEETVIANGYAYSLKPVENLDLATIPEGYYHIKNAGNGSYVNVLGRRTALVNLSEEDAETAAGAVIKVKATNGKVEILRSQAIDIPSYAQRAMRYVPEVVTLVVDKLGVDGSGRILGENGVDAILQKFYDEFDYNLYVENAGDGYRIFGRTPSMQPVLDFYKENKENVDYKLPGLEQAINDAIAKVVEKVGRGYSLEGSFSLHTIWERMGAQNLTEPNDDASKLAFLQEVLSSKNHVWNFAYQTATFYAEKVEGHLDQVSEVLEGVDVSKYIELAKKIRPDFKYYIVQKDGKMDIISEGNADIIGNSDIAIWQLEQTEQFSVNVPEANSRIANIVFDEDRNRVSVGKAYYTTLYTDFGYQLPEGAVALKVKAINQTKIDKEPIEGLGLLVTEEIGREVAPQTPVLIKSDQPGDIVLTIGDNYGEPVDETTNLLRGVDWLINEYEINTPMLETLYGMAEEFSPTTAEQYEHLIRRNAGTVNNKYFFGLDIEDLASAYKQKTGNEMEKNPILLLGKKENKRLAFNANEDWGKIGANTPFLFSEEFNPAVFSLLGDVNRDGIVSSLDVNALVNICKWRDKEDYNYDYEAADIDFNETYNGLDINSLINIIKFRTPHPDLP